VKQLVPSASGRPRSPCASTARSGASAEHSSTAGQRQPRNPDWRPVNSSELTDLLRPLNPAKSDPQAPPVEDLLTRLDQTDRRLSDPIPVKRTRGLMAPRPRIAIGFASAAAAGLVVFVTFGSSGGTTNVLADVYRALNPGTGVLHMTQVTEQTVAGKTSTTHQELWTAQNPRRLRSVTAAPEGVTYEQAFSASPLEDRRWSSESGRDPSQHPDRRVDSRSYAGQPGPRNVEEGRAHAGGEDHS
jgi:hypothetical protein